MNKFKLILSKSNDPSINLAFEEYLISKKEPVIYLWQNEPTIVIGRNQNPFSECNLNKIIADKIHLMRRRSGGGAVFHDLGNLNFTIISNKYETVIEDNFKLVNKVLNLYGINSNVSGRNDLEIEGKKISGSAFFEEGDVFCHHGTLLIDVNINKLGEYLTASKLKLDSKSIKSVKSRVINLKEINIDLDINLIIKGFEKVLNTKAEEISEDKLINNKDIFGIVNKYRSYSWTYGETIDFNVQFDKKLSFGIVNLRLLVSEGIIKIAKFYSDNIVDIDFEFIEKALIQTKFNKEDIKNKLYSLDISKDLKDEFISIFNEM